jgi:putative transposase
MIGARPISLLGRPGSIASADGRRGGGRRRLPFLRPSEPASADAGQSVTGRADELVKAKARIAEGGPAFFSRSLAAMGRDEPKRRRACLYAVIQEMIAAEPQGFLKDDANVQRLCGLAQVSRAGYYRRRGPRPPAREEADLRDLIQRIALADRHYRHYGYRRIAVELRRQGLIVNAKRVLRLMRADNLLSLRARPFIPRTTDSRHGCAIVPNLTRVLVPSGLDQIWVADITYVRLAEAFVYLAIVLDAFSRKVIGWALADHLEARLAIEALDMALNARDPKPNSLIHHSDSQRIKASFRAA